MKNVLRTTKVIGTLQGRLRDLKVKEEKWLLKQDERKTRLTSVPIRDMEG